MSRRGSRIVELLSSMRFAIALLVVLAVASMIGTVLKQQEPYPNYINQFGLFWADIFRTLGLYHVYGAWWFIAILAFLVVSLSLCVARHGVQKIAEIRRWKNQLQVNSLRALRHHAQWHIANTDGTQPICTRLTALIKKHGYRYIIQPSQHATLIAAKRGVLNKSGYFLTHLSVIVICLGGLLDSSLPIRFQMWLFDKHPMQDHAVIDSMDSKHRLAASNLTFRGVAWVPEGQQVSTAILNGQDGTLVQDLPFTIQLNRFIVEYYSTGMPKRFASDVVVTDSVSGEHIPARIEVNKPFIHRGVAIYQSSFEDGGSTLQLTAYPMTGANTHPFKLSGQVNSSTPLRTVGDGETIEFSDFRPLNIENIWHDASQRDAHNPSRRSLKERFTQHLSSAAKTTKPLHLHNIGPSIQYKVRDKSGQAREFNNYMQPMDIDGERVFLTGMRKNSTEPFRYLRIPADRSDSVKEWMLLRAALADATLRAKAAQRFAARSVKQAGPLQQQLVESATRILGIFSGVGNGSHHNHDSGFAAVADFINQSVPKAQQEQAAALLLRLLEGVVWDLWQVARAHAHEAPAQINTANSRFIQSSIHALSDSFYYDSPVFLQLDTFKEVKASIFQLTKTPGKKIVYWGSVFLVLGIIAMFYLKERRLWLWLQTSHTGVDLLIAMSSTRITLDFEKEFTHIKHCIGTILDRLSISSEVK